MDPVVEATTSLFTQGAPQRSVTVHGPGTWDLATLARFANPSDQTPPPMCIAVSPGSLSATPTARAASAADTSDDAGVNFYATLLESQGCVVVPSAQPSAIATAVAMWNDKVPGFIKERLESTLPTWAEIAQRFEQSSAKKRGQEAGHPQQ